MKHLRNFAKHKEQDPNTGGTLSQGIFWVVAQGGFKSVGGEIMQHKRQTPPESKGTKDTEREIPKCHGTLQVPSRSLFKVFLSVINRQKVHHDAGNRHPALFMYKVVQTLGTPSQFPTAGTKRRGHTFQAKYCEKHKKKIKKDSRPCKRLWENKLILLT